MKNKILLLLAASLVFSACKKSKKGDPDPTTPPVETTKIIGEANHSAFTDLIRFGNNFYCTFREAPGHISSASTPGKVRVLKSSDGITWSNAAVFEMDQKDVRDPKLSITPDNRIMVWMDIESYGTNGTTVASRIPFVSFSDNTGSSFSAPAEVNLSSDIKAAHNWIWRITWHKGVGYGVDYLGTGPLTIVKTVDGKNFTKVSRITVDGNPNEATIRFDQNDKMYVLIRREQLDQKGVLASSLPPYTDFQQTKLSFRLGGPDFMFLDNSTLCIGTRSYATSGQASGTAVFVTDLNGNILKSIQLPSGGDSSYPGMLIHDNKLWVSYYSSHQGKTQIYLSKIPVSALK